VTDVETWQTPETNKTSSERSDRGVQPRNRTVNLRRRLDDGLDPEFLKTVIGVGYKLQ
jgi:hypothetical protein